MSLTSNLKNALNSLLHRFTGLKTEPVPAQEIEKKGPAEMGRLVAGNPDAPVIAKPTENAARDYAAHRTGPAIRAALASSVPAFIESLALNRYPKALTDAEFQYFVDTGPLGSMLAEDDPETVQSAEPLIVLDNSNLASLKTFDGMHSAGVKIYFKKRNFELHKIRIIPSEKDSSLTQTRVWKNWIGQRLLNSGFDVLPRDKAWSVAKLLAMWALNHTVTLGQHPQIHFPLTAVAVATETRLTKENPMRWFLEPHLRFTMGINNAVLSSPDSILFNHNSLASPFDGRIEDMAQTVMLPAGSKAQFAIPVINGGYDPAFRYGRMMSRYWEEMLLWVMHFADKTGMLEPSYLSRFQEEFRAWDNLCRTNMYGWIPEGEEFHFTIKNGKRRIALPRYLTCMAVVAMRASFEHSSQHWLYSQIPVRSKPWRWRCRIPKHAQDEVNYKVDDLWPAVDAFQLGVANRTFFNVNPASSIQDVRYCNDKQKEIEMHYSEWQDRIKKIEREYPELPLCKVAPSIDF